MSNASPQRTHSVVVCARRPSKHESQRGEDPALSNGPPQALQSAGKNVVTRSSYIARASCAGLFSTRETARHSSTRPELSPARLPGGPGGAPVLLSSELSFQRWLKTHLTRGMGNFHTNARSIAPPHIHTSTIRHHVRCTQQRPLPGKQNNCHPERSGVAAQSKDLYFTLRAATNSIE